MVNDEVHNPSHYERGGMKAKDVMKAMLDGMLVPGIVAHWWATAFKYLWRWPVKNGVKDLKKCRESLDILIEEAEAAGMR